MAYLNMTSNQNLWFLNFSEALLGSEGEQIFVRVSGQCVFCRNSATVILNPEQFDAACSGNLHPIQVIRDREFLISGICHKCQLTLFENQVATPVPFSHDKTETKAYVTNAVARSVAFYAMAYLNNQGYDSKKIEALRREMSLDNMASGRFTIDELLQSFEKQSAFFLNLYRQLSEDEFLHFAERLMDNQRFFSVFKHYNNVYDLMQHFNRIVYHTTLNCNWMRRDYQEETFHPNTGVFQEKVAKKACDPQRARHQRHRRQRWRGRIAGHRWTCHSHVGPHDCTASSANFLRLRRSNPAFRYDLITALTVVI